MKGRDLLRELGDEVTPEKVRALLAEKEREAGEGSTSAVERESLPISRSTPPIDGFSAMLMD